MDFKNFANHFKDAALQVVAKWAANRHQLNKLGRITNLRVNSDAQEVFLDVDLHGEETPVELTVHYRVLSPTLLEIVAVQASRQWMTALINDVIPAEQKRLTVPTAVTRALSKLDWSSKKNATT